MSDQPTDPIATQLAAQLLPLRESIDRLSTQVGELAADNRDLRTKLEASEAARRDLRAQSEQLLHMLELARKEVRKLSATDAG
ncbi:MAG: hypothetical protein AB8H80_20210 [Planctomycetota bacterium]